MAIIRKIIYCFLLGFSHLCYGQISSPSLHFDHLTISDGLSHNTIYCLLQDHNGYIWIGTQNGLNKYDGYSFQVFYSLKRNNRQEGFIGKHISALFEDKAGNLWVGTKKNGINLKSKLSNRFVNLQDDVAFAAIRGYDISSFFEDESGNIWITTVGAGVLKFNPSKHTSQKYTQKNSNLSSNVCFDVVEDKYGTIWVATAGGGLNMLIDQQFELSHEMLPNHPNMGSYRKKMLLDNEYLWIATEGTGLYKMDLRDLSYQHFAPGNGKFAISSNVVRDIYLKDDGRLFIATDGKGLDIYDTNSEQLSPYRCQLGDKKALNSNALFCLLGDRTGNIWIGTYNGGINIYKPQKTWFDFFAPSLTGGDELQHRSILSVAQSKDGHILLGTDGGGLTQFKPENDQVLTTSLTHKPDRPSSIAGNVIKTIFEDSRQRIWVGIFGKGLDLFQAESLSFDHIISRPLNVWSISERKNGDILLATLGNGVFVVDEKSKDLSRFQIPSSDLNSATDLNISTVFVDNKDRIWIGSLDNGLDMIDEAGNQFRHYKHNPLDSLSISNDEIRVIYQDKRGALWIGTEGGGLNRWLGGESFERIGEKEGLIASSVMGMIEDNNGLLWVTTFEGISVLEPENLNIKNYNFRTSENTNQFNQNAIFTDQEGKLYFGGINGLHAIWPDQVEKDRPQADLIFTDLKIYGQSVDVGKLPNGRTILKEPIESSSDIWLSYLDQSFTIFFSAVDYINPLENEFAFQMKGFNEDWEYTSAGQRSATYTNLDAGTYLFRIKHKDKIASIKIHIAPPYWERTWFKVLLSVLSTGLVFSGLYFWIKRREAAANRRILQLQNEKLATEVEAKNSKLMFSSVQMAHKNEILTEIKKSLLELIKKPENHFRSLIRKLDYELKNEDYWKEFNLYFNEVDKNFLDKIIKKHPELTKNDLRMCSLLRINLSTKEIASLLNISVRAVEQSRYRLKKRLGLNKSDDLSKYISSFSQ